MAKIQIKSDKITLFGGIFPIMDEFDRVLSGIVDSTLGFRCRLFGYQFSEIIRHLCAFTSVAVHAQAYAKLDFG